MGWLVIAGVVFGGVYYFTDLRLMTRLYLQSASETADSGEGRVDQLVAAGGDGMVRLRAAENGHFLSEAEINGRPVNVVVDTGATGVALTYEDAREIGLRLSEEDFTMESQTANGISRIAPIMLDKVQIGDIEVRDVEAFVAQPGRLFQTLLGMSFLKRLSHIDIRGQELILAQ